MAELPALVEKLLAKRGLFGEEREEFLAPDIRRLSKAASLPGIAEAATRLIAAVRERRQIVVFGDYDCDGVAATAILVQALNRIAGESLASPFLPQRLSEGYGMTGASIERMLRTHPAVGMVVTVDNGINSVAEVAALKARGIEVVVTDHHLPGEQLPPASVVVDPRLAAPPELADLCGAAVAFFLARELYRQVFADRDASPGVSRFLVLAGLATVTDVMPLKGQNRILVAEALRRFPRFAPPGLMQLYRRAVRTPSERMLSRDFGFLLGPRINAVGRVAEGADSSLAVRLLLEPAAVKAEAAVECASSLAEAVDAYNVRRRDLEQRLVDRALAEVVEGAAAQVLDLPGGHPGVAGIVAARVMDRLAHPVPVAVIVDGHGSARAPAGHNVRAELEAAADALERFGGHALAAGFAVKAGRLEDFRRGFVAACAAAAAVPAGEESPVELWVEKSDLTLEGVAALRRLEPFGEGNPEPVFGFGAVELKDVWPMGADGRHLSLTVNGIRAVWWHHGDRVEELRAAGGRFDLVFTAGVSTYGGEQHVELVVRELKESTGG